MKPELPQIPSISTPEPKKPQELINSLIERINEIKIIPQELNDYIKEKNIFYIPQLGHYHNEGPLLGYHINLMLETIDKINKGEFDFEIINFPPEFQQEAKSLIIQIFKEKTEELKAFTILHDIGKVNCMTIRRKKPDEKFEEIDFSMEQWLEILEKNNGDPKEALSRLKEEDYEQINYRKQNKDHGKESEELIRRTISEEEIKNKNLELVLKAIEAHEIHFQVFNQTNSAKTYEEHIIKRNFTEEDINFLYAACFLDLAGALNKDNQYNFTGFINMLIARRSYFLIEQLRKEYPDIKENELNKLLNMNVKSITEIEKNIERTKRKLMLERMTIEENEIDEILKRIERLGISKEEINQIIRPIFEEAAEKEKPVLNFVMKELPLKLSPKLKQHIGKIREVLESYLEEKLKNN